MSKSNLYLALLEKHKIKPNFWCSEEYFAKAGLTTVIYEKTGNVGIEDKTDGTIITMFPRLHEQFGMLPAPPCWADFEGFEVVNPYREFLDYEFIYDPKRFLDMSGGDWQVFRKNSRKFPNRMPPGSLRYVNAKAHEAPEKLRTTLVEWLSGLGDRTEVHDEDVILRYLFDGQNRKFLIDADYNEIYGINIWDENYHYINYRYCFCGKENFLSEYMRLLFYTDPEILNKNKFVNDGGCLGSEALKKFKEKLNPVQVREVYTYYKHKLHISYE